MGSIAQRWKVLSGENNWEGLLDPLDIDLRHYIIHYGDRIQAVVDSFIEDKGSNNIGLSRYIKRHLFPKVGLVIGNPFDYIVNKYLYASTKNVRPPLDPDLPKTLAGYSNWIGYVAVSSDAGTMALGRRDILISLRGTMKQEEWYIDLLSGLVSASDILGMENDPKLHNGWYTYYTTADPESTFNTASLRDQVLGAVRELVDEYKDKEVSITVIGHSMGGAFSSMIATDIVYNGYNKTIDHPNKAYQVTAFMFAGPAVGDEGYKSVFSRLENLHALQVRNLNDIVPNILTPLLGYVHVGQKLVFDSLESPYLKQNPIETLHDLQVYLHGIAGTQGLDGGFRLEVKRDIALVNKRIDGLKDEYHVTPQWWCVNNKGMVQLDDGYWVMILDREIDDDKAACTS
ncbi:hypothetical protein FNV43_RR08995 [Rhamnella rubrinervis]|uniref:Phospholipase A1 n=1 Tax=Rhamnella rubrinervis TaxID=2594499 RepID=A0A8K0MJK3_9ROSA|nr:hypothetical protein FNV43_RR08995 [Rhamnella rubrinervis]